MYKPWCLGFRGTVNPIGVGLFVHVDGQMTAETSTMCQILYKGNGRHIHSDAQSPTFEKSIQTGPQI